MYPSLFTPNGDGYNDQIFFIVDNPNNPDVSGQIHDLTGRFVAQLSPGQSSGLGTTLSWNGRDENGAVASSGLYIYRLTGEGKDITGTVSLAR